MENKDKKYFLKETGEELEFGDVIGLTCVKELEDGRATVEKEVKFSPETVDLLLHFDLIETQESLIDFPEDEEDEDFNLEEFINSVNEDLGNHEDRIDILEKELGALKATIMKQGINEKSSPKKK